MHQYWDFLERTDCGTLTPTRATSEREQCCPKSRTKRNGSLPMSASRLKEASRGTARPVFGPDFRTTLARLESVLDRLGEAGLKLKAKKCQLFQEEIPFLGHIVSAAGIGTDPAKCQQVRDWPVPRDLHEVLSFVGLLLVLQEAHSGFHRVRVGDQGNGF